MGASWRRCMWSSPMRRICCGPAPPPWPFRCACLKPLCIFAFFTPAAIPGLTLGCLLYNVSWAQALPLTGWWGVWPPFWPPPPCGVAEGTPRPVSLPGPFDARPLECPPGWLGVGRISGRKRLYLASVWFERPVRIPGEAAVLLVLGTILYYAVTARKLDQRLFQKA